MKKLIDKYPTLTKALELGVLEMNFIYDPLLNIPENLISNITIIPFIGDKVVLLRLGENNAYEIIGGTLELNEKYMEALKRELMEEVGAVLKNFTPIVYIKSFSKAEKPFREHIPHPISYRLIGFGDIEIVGKPTDYIQGIEYNEVIIASLEEAKNMFLESKRPEFAELYSFAKELNGNLNHE